MNYLNMVSLRGITYRQTYNKIDHDIASEFYLPSMANSTSYDRMSGYFGSTIFVIAWDALKTFVNNGGKIRIICSPCLSDDDVIAIQTGERALIDEILNSALQDELNRIMQSEDLYQPFKVLSALIAKNVVEIKVAYGNAHSSFIQLFHDKVGIFSDGDNYVSFRGSINETYKGLSNNGNIESISVFTSWNNQSDAERIKYDRQLFEKLWSDKAQGVVVSPLPHDFKQLIAKNHSTQEWEKLVDEIRFDLKHRSEWMADTTGSRTPRKHQLTALQSWAKNGHRGILEHATGSGKTFTCLCAIRRSIKEGKTILILVPSIDLLKQWYEEVKTTFSDLNPSILLCGDIHKSWKKDNRLSTLTSPMSSSPKITIATMDTAVMDSFLSNITQGDHLFVVADEVHRMGSLNRRKFFATKAGYRLGVSATPKRFGDEEGTESIIAYFGKILDPSYLLQDAINDDVLTRYFYCPKEVCLTEQEQEEWDEVSLKIKERYARLLALNKEGTNADDNLKYLLLRRARIIKKAQGKVQLTIDILRDHYKPGQKWIVYCEDTAQLKDVVNNVLSQLPNIDVREYYSGMEGDREETLKAFTLYGGVVISIKCLDEGVDIPSTTHAIILASSKNPREFIQRRGRVLRKFPGKNFSWVYDAIVVPSSTDIISVKSDAILCGELSRAIEFAEWSETQSATTNLRMIAARYQININEFNKIGLEDE